MSKKAKHSARRKAWRACAGVNKRTGRVKPGYKMAKGGSCPTHVGKHHGKRMSRAARVAAAYHSGSRSYASNYAAAHEFDPSAMPISGARRRGRRRRRR